MKNNSHSLTGLRYYTDLGTCYLALLFAILGMVQVFLAGLGVFGHDFEAHTTLGRVLSLLAIVILVLALIARHSQKTILGAVALVVLIGVASGISGMGWDTPWLGGLHALIGIVSVITADTISRRLFKKSR